jgi:pyruvate-formate lyase
MVHLDDISLTQITLADLNGISELKNDYIKALPEICIERPRLLTEYYKNNNLFAKNQIPISEKAKSLAYILDNRKICISQREAANKKNGYFKVKVNSPFAGSTTSKFKGVPLFPELVGLMLWPEIGSLNARSTNPYRIKTEETDALNHDIFPEWMNFNILEIVRKRIYDKNLSELGLKNYAPELKLLQTFLFFLTSKPVCISHTIPYFEKAVYSGLSSIITEAGKLKEHTADAEKVDFYTSIEIVLSAVIRYSERIADEALKAANECSDENKKRFFKEISDIYRHVPAQPARNYREGLTTVWLCWTSLLLENANIGLSLGRLDQLLYPLYSADMQNHWNDHEHLVDMLELTCHFWLKFGDHVPMMTDSGEALFGGTGANQAITIGGVSKDETDAVNDLTYIMLRTLELLKVRDPNVAARYHRQNGEEYLHRLIKCNINSGAIPAIYSDKNIIPTLYSKSQSNYEWDYGIVGCVEPCESGRHFGHPASILLNLPSVLELTLFNGAHRHIGLDRTISITTGDPRNFNSFPEFKKAFYKQASWIVDQATNLNHSFAKAHEDFLPTPLLSSLFQGPLINGKDVTRGGAELNSSGAALVGFADVVDSLCIIQKLVFDTHQIEFAELLDAISTNYQNDPILQKQFMQKWKVLKFGSTHPVSSANASWITSTFNDIFREKKNSRGGSYRVGYWSMTLHCGWGKVTPALPSGRSESESLASGITPTSTVTSNLTPFLDSVAVLPGAPMSGGIALNCSVPRFSKLPEAERLKRIDWYINGYFSKSNQTRDGGMQLQFNVHDPEIFKKARDKPEKYSDLIVRVSGYTAYFVDLPRSVQDEIINRPLFPI